MKRAGSCERHAAGFSGHEPLRFGTRHWVKSVNRAARNIDPEERVLQPTTTDTRPAMPPLPTGLRHRIDHDRFSKTRMVIDSLPTHRFKYAHSGVLLPLRCQVKSIDDDVRHGFNGDERAAISGK